MAHLTILCFSVKYSMNSNTDGSPDPGIWLSVTEGIAHNRTTSMELSISKLFLSSFQRKIFTEMKLLNRLSYPLSVFGRSDTRTRVRLPRQLVKNLIVGLAIQDVFQTIRSLIEVVFKISQICVLFEEFSQVYDPFCQKNGLPECTFDRTHHSSGISFKEAITKAFWMVVFGGG